MARKHTKYSQEWLDNIKLLVPKKNTTEKDDKGNIIDKLEVEVHGEKIKTLNDEIEALDQEIKTGKGKTQKAKSIYKAYKNIKNKRQNWIDHLQNGATNYGVTATQINLHGANTDYQTLSDNLRNGGAYNWNGKLTAHYNKDITVGKAYTDNLYELNIPNDTTKYEIVEEELITVLGRIFEGLRDIDVDKFCAKYNTVDTNTAQQGNVRLWLENIQKEAKCLVKNKNGDMYDFGYTFRENNWQGEADLRKDGKRRGTRNKDGKLEILTTPYEARPYETVLTEFFTWFDLVNKKPVLDALDTDISQYVSVNIKTKGDKYTGDERRNLIDNYGITLRNDQQLYKNGTAYKGFSQSGGVKSWIALAETIGSASNRDKILNSFSATVNPNPTRDLFNSMGDSLFDGNANYRWNENTKSWHDGTRAYTLDAMPRSIEEAEEIMDELEVQKDLEIRDAVLSNQEVGKKQTEKDQKESEKSKLTVKIDALIKAELVTKRTDLDTYKIKDGFEITKKADGTVDKDNRRTYTDLLTIKSKLNDIRYLENADDEADSSNTDENTAYTAINNLVIEYNASKLHLFSITDGATNADKCNKIGKTNLKAYKEEYEKWGAEKIKLTTAQEQELKDIKTAMGEKDNSETLKTYTDKLKAFDASLETKFTEDLKNKWQGDEAKNFQNSTSLKTLLETVKKNDKYDDFFNHIKGGVNGYEDVKDIDNWGKLLVKDPKVVITAVKRYEYDNLDDTGEDKDKKKTQMERKIKKVLSKKGTDNLTDAEINTTLYEVAIGTKTLSTKSLKADLTEYEETPNKNNEVEKTHLQKWWPLYAGIGVGVLAIGGACYYFWESICNWWNPPADDNKGGLEKD